MPFLALPLTFPWLLLMGRYLKNLVGKTGRHLAQEGVDTFSLPTPVGCRLFKTSADLLLIYCPVLSCS